MSEPTSHHDCQCAAPGWCELLKMQMGQRMHAICRRDAEGLTPERCDEYRALWLAAAHPEWFDPSKPRRATMPLDCPQRGLETRREHCPSCSGQVLVKVHACGLHAECTLSEKKLAGVRNCLTCADLPANRPRYISTAQLVADTYALAGRLPAKLSGIIGVSRSGLTPAALLCQHLHLPLWILRQDATPAQYDEATYGGRGDIVPAGNGWRIATRPVLDGPLLVVDDTQMTGRSIARAREVVARELPDRKVLYAAIYKNPQLAAGSVDYCAAALPKPHFLEWNLFNSVHLPQTAFDFDGVLTRDGTNEPLYLPRKGRVPLIVTGRSERHRAGSLGWLAHWGVKVDRLVMFPGDTPRESLAIARYKADHFGASRLAYFVESDAEQAAEIARLVGRSVICPAAAKVF